MLKNNNGILYHLNRVEKKLILKDPHYFKGSAYPYILSLAKNSNGKGFKVAIIMLKMLLDIYGIDSLDTRNSFTNKYMSPPHTNSEYFDLLTKESNSYSSWICSVLKVSKLMKSLRHDIPHYSPHNAGIMYLMLNGLNNALRATVMEEPNLITMYDMDYLLSKIGCVSWRNRAILDKVTRIRKASNELLQKNSAKLGMVAGGISCQC